MTYNTLDLKVLPWVCDSTTNIRIIWLRMKDAMIDIVYDAKYRYVLQMRIYDTNGAIWYLIVPLEAQFFSHQIVLEREEVRNPQGWSMYVMFDSKCVLQESSILVCYRPKWDHKLLGLIFFSRMGLGLRSFVWTRNEILIKVHLEPMIFCLDQWLSPPPLNKMELMQYQTWFLDLEDISSLLVEVSTNDSI